MRFLILIIQTHMENRCNVFLNIAHWKKQYSFENCLFDYCMENNSYKMGVATYIKKMRFNKSKLDFLEANNNPYETNIVLYMSLLVLSAMVIVVSIFFDRESFLSVVLMGVGSGGIASVTIAWLLDVSTCRFEKKKAEYSKKILIMGVSNTIATWTDLYIKLLNDVSDCAERPASDSVWIDQIEHAYIMAKEKNALDDFYMLCQLFTQNLLEELKAMQYQTAQLLYASLIKKEDAQVLSISISMCSAIYIRSKNVQKTEDDQVLQYFHIIKKSFDQSEIFRSINEVKSGTVVEY